MGVLEQVDKHVDAHAIVFMRCLNAVSEIVSKTVIPQFTGPENEPPGIVQAAAVMMESVIAKIGDYNTDAMIAEYQKELEEHRRLAVEERTREREVATQRIVREATLEGHHGG